MVDTASYASQKTVCVAHYVQVLQISDVCMDLKQQQKNEIEKHFPEEARTCEISYKKRFSSGIIKSGFFWPMTTQLTTLL